VKKIELVIRDSQCGDIENILTQSNVPFYKNNLNNNNISDVKLVQYAIFSPDDTSRRIMKDIEKFLHTDQKDSIMATHSLEATFSKYLNKFEEKTSKNKGSSKLIQEFRTMTEPAVDIRRDLLFVVLIASAAALIGLFAGNPSIIIGAMLIAPLLKPITALTFNVSLFDTKKIIKSGLSVSILLGSIVGISTLLTIIGLQMAPLEITDEIQLRTETSPTFMILAVVLGMAGALAMTSNIPGILVGVAISAALVPPAVVIGIGIAMLDYDIIVGASILTLSNVIGLLLGTLTVFLLAGVTPKQYHQKDTHQIKYIIFIISVLVVVSVVSFWLSF